MGKEPQNLPKQVTIHVKKLQARAKMNMALVSKYWIMAVALFE